MTRRIILLLSCAFCLQLAFAQSMSDDDIKSFVLAERENGVSKQEIAKKLLQKGVTPDRLREIKSKHENGNSLLGVSKLDDKKTLDSRLREQNETSHVDENIEQVDEAFVEMSEIPTVFGRNIFNNKLLTFESSKNIPIPSNYILGAGDVVIIDIWGASQNMIEAEISPEGKIVVESVGPLHLAGKSVKEANKYVNDVLGKIYAESSISLSVGTTRSIVVQVLGEVTTPGSYTMSALSTVFNALYAAGGISEIGTLRSINVFRKGKNIAAIDVYDYIFNGNVDGNVNLQDNDVISVGAYEAIVNVDGKVKRPMMYEMKEGETLSSLIRFSGGFTGDAYSDKLRVVRKSGREYSLYTVERQNLGSFDICDGDVVYVDSVIQRFSNMVEVTGAVFFPGQYQFCNEINSVKELLEAAGGVREDAFLDRAILHHRNYDNTIEASQIDLKGVINGTVSDVALRNNDILFIPSESDMKGEQTITVNGEVNFPGKYKFAKNTTIKDVILQAGGLTRAASVAKIDVFRQYRDPMAVIENDTIVEYFSFDIKDGFIVDGKSDFVLEPFDEVSVRRSPAYEDVSNVTVQGAVLYEGVYALQSKTVRISEIIKQAGGLSSSAYKKGALIVRKVTDEDMAQRKMLQTLSNVDFYESLIEENSDFTINQIDSLLGVKFGNGDMVNVPINLEKALENPQSEYDIILRDGDIIKIPEYSSIVKVQGEVRFPTVINYKEGTSLNDYIKKAGGFARNAKKNSIYVINMNGSAKKMTRFSKRIEPGCEIIVPRKKLRRSMTTGEIMTIGTTSASLATMVVTLLNLLAK